ncbi:hypothetical protein [Clostridium uliginosum]|uniref:Uncharacterized protein n=1 Tax=Clostridium uliginosum TaxID=119641 RepID=A0A1I1L2N9_9CLOT|nr:hypothetical protein [Clostridium uliginosum]SFC63880.1 hypothetical protein SAMN05421842_106141 [Clostridium uliginosum]
MDIKIKDLTQVIPNSNDLVLISQNENVRGSTVEEVRDKELRKEVENARGIYANLDDRLDEIDTSVLALEKKIDPIDCGMF